MSKIALYSNASGTGTFTLASPNSNTDRTLTLPDATGTLQLSGGAVTGTTGDFSSTIKGGSTISVGGATPSASGAGISFPATQSASTDANTLDDYEEGTWTPVLTASTVGNLSVSYTYQNGVYTKIGNLVTVTGFIITSAFSYTTASGGVNITGLPFTSISTIVQAHGGTSYTGYTKTNFPQVTALVAQSDNKVILYSCGSAQTRTQTSITDFPTGGTVGLAFTITYTTT